MELLAREALAAVVRDEEALDLDPRFRSIFLVMSRVEPAVRRVEHQLETDRLIEPTNTSVQLRRRCDGLG